MMIKRLPFKISLPVFFMLCLAGNSHLYSAEAKSNYIKIGPSEDQSLILEFSGDSIKIAENLEKLKNAVPVKCKRNENRNNMVNLVSPQIVLKFPAANGKKPPITKAEINMLQHTRGSTIYGMLTTEIKDEEGNIWSYVNRLFARPETDPSKLKLIKTPSSEGVKLEISNLLDKRDKKKMGIAIQLRAESGEISDIINGSKMVNAKVTLTDPEGNKTEVVKNLSQLGYG